MGDWWAVEGDQIDRKSEELLDFLNGPSKYTSHAFDHTNTFELLQVF